MRKLSIKAGITIETVNNIDLEYIESFEAKQNL